MHAKRPIRSTIRSRKNCTRKEASGARFGAQEVAREKTIWSTIWSTKSCARKSCAWKGPSGTRFEAQKAARENIPLEHDLEEKKLHQKKQSEAWCGAQKVAREKNRSGARFDNPIWSTKSWKNMARFFLQNEVVFCTILKDLNGI